MTKSRIFRTLVTLVVCYAGLQGIVAMSQPATKLGVTDGRLSACPDKPNCVSSQAVNDPHAIEALPITGDPTETWKTLRSVVTAFPRTRIVEERDDYLCCEFRTAIMRFVDDVEFLLDAEKKSIHFRSASRLGYSDMGANRKRMEQIRSRFEDALKNASN